MPTNRLILSANLHATSRSSQLTSGTIRAMNPARSVILGYSFVPEGRLWFAWILPASLLDYTANRPRQPLPSTMGSQYNFMQRTATGKFSRRDWLCTNSAKSFWIRLEPHFQLGYRQPLKALGFGTAQAGISLLCGTHLDRELSYLDAHRRLPHSSVNRAAVTPASRELGSR